ncbi:MAG TPA: asparagine synthase (glutamine-hydrolyzing) [Oscillatoriaceae cyanobacterium]
MCGIVGYVGAGDRELLARMNAAIVHRGPDDAGAFVAPGVGLAMRRLSIIDLAGGHQPIANETGHMQIVFNGELYNYRELRAQYLEAHRFSSASDTEVVLHLYEELGPAAFEKLNGMYAFALWDGDREVLYLVRDRLGIKPLYVHAGPTRVCFASELKALLVDPALPRTLAPGALVAYLTWQYVPGEETLLAGVRRVPPGHYMRLEPGKPPSLESYWQPRFSAGPARAEELAERLRQAVRRQMVADVPVGAFLSGGIDSSLVVALMAESGARIETFTAGFADPRFDESPWAAQVARHLGVANHVVRLDASALSELPTLAWHLDEPIGDRAALPTLLLSRLARRHVKVVLTGEGSDELFAGYPRYRLELLAQRFHRLPLSRQAGLWRAIAGMLPARMRRSALKLLLSPHDPAARRAAWLSSVSEDWRARLMVASEPLAPIGTGDEGLEAQLLLDLRTWLVNDVLMKVDKTTMAASLEARVPFLDHELVDWALTLPTSARLSGGVGKQAVRQAAERLLPEAIRRRPKQAFHTPTAAWLREARGRELLGDVLLGSAARERGLLRTGEVEAMMRAHAAGEDHDQALWSLLMLELWCQAYLDRAGVAA